ncbi:MAG: hypothetical protein H6825_00500 [Planctomycetes bacterium]|nr:hypothetical protein [Planctomycetota bacterium]
MRRVRPIASLALLALAGALPAQTIEVPIQPKATYLHASANDMATDAVAIPLSAIPAVSGQCLRLISLGAMDNGPSGDTINSTIAVFSASATLLDKSNLHRVVDAIDAGDEFISAATLSGNQPTDIPEDFRVTSALQADVVVQIPVGATHVFVCNHDSQYGDNSDPNGDHRIQITVVGTWTELGTGLAGTSGVPQLDGTGLMLGNDPWTLTLTDAGADKGAWLVLGLAEVDAPFKGGLIVPCVDILLGPLSTGPAGTISLTTTWPAGVPSGASVWTQYWIQETPVAAIFSSSAGLKATAP